MGNGIDKNVALLGKNHKSTDLSVLDPIYKRRDKYQVKRPYNEYPSEPHVLAETGVCKSFFLNSVAFRIEKYFNMDAMTYLSTQSRLISMFALQLHSGGLGLRRNDGPTAWLLILSLGGPTKVQLWVHFSSGSLHVYFTTRVFIFRRCNIFSAATYE